MYRFLLRPKWLAFHVLVVAAIVAMVNLAFWQLRRLDERREFNALIEQRYDAPPVALDDLLAEAVDPASGDDFDADRIEWRQVTVEGTYLPEETFFVVNRSQNGRAGRNVVVPLRLADGRILVVNRGFVPLQVDAVPDVPALEVSLLGHLRATQERRLGQLSDPAAGDLVEVQRIDLDRLAPQLPGDVVPMYVDLLVSDPPETLGLPEPVAAPELTERNHLSYAVQWFIFSMCAAAGWVIVIRRSAQASRQVPDAVSDGQ